MTMTTNLKLSDCSNDQDALILEAESSGDFSYAASRYMSANGKKQLDAIISKHPWATNFVFAIHENHLSHVIFALREIESIIGHEKLKEVLYLRLATLRSHRFSNEPDAYVHLSMSYHLKGGAASPYAETMEDLKKSLAPNSKFMIKDGHDKEESADNKSDDSEPQPSEVRVVHVDALSVLKNLAHSGDEKGRIRNAIKKFQSTRDFRPLCKFPLEVSFPNFPNFAELTEFIDGQRILSNLADGSFLLPPILLIGDPGVGKTEYIMRLANILKTGFLKLNLGSAQSGSPLSGSDIYWSNSRTGELFDELAFGHTANPIVFLDEIDKINSRESPVGALYSLLEKRSAKEFSDLALPGVKLDASNVLWFAAANDRRGIEPAILSRFRIFEIPIPNKNQMPCIVQSVYKSLLSSATWGRHFQPTLSKKVVDIFESLPPRFVRQTLENAILKACKDGRTEVIAEDVDPVTPSRKMGFRIN